MINFLHALIFPHEKNNYRARILHASGFLLILVTILILSFFARYFKTERPDILGISYSISEGELLSLVNKERQDRGLPHLTLNTQLSDASRRKASDMFQKNYWAHFAPDGSTSPWAFIKSSGYNYTFAGENLAKGFSDSASIVSAWMSSPTHRDNILSPRYNDVGFAIIEGSLTGEETVLVVEMFGATAQRTLAAVPAAQVASAQEQEQASPSGFASQETALVISPEPLREANEGATPVSSSQAAFIKNPKIDVSITSKAISTVGLSFLAFAFIMDLIIVERKKIPRVVGHNIDHVMLILLFILFIILKSGGVIL
jgi:uncharacterized protein YkwD